MSDHEAVTVAFDELLFHNTTATLLSLRGPAQTCHIFHFRYRDSVFKKVDTDTDKIRSVYIYEIYIFFVSHKYLPLEIILFKAFLDAKCEHFS